MSSLIDQIMKKEQTRVRVSAYSSVNPALVKKLQNHDLSLSSVQQVISDNIDYSVYRQKQPPRINLYDKIIDDQGKTLSSGPSGRKTIETSRINVCFQFCEHR